MGIQQFLVDLLFVSRESLGAPGSVCRCQSETALCWEHRPSHGMSCVLKKIRLLLPPPEIAIPSFSVLPSVFRSVVGRRREESRQDVFPSQAWQRAGNWFLYA